MCTTNLTLQCATTASRYHGPSSPKYVQMQPFPPPATLTMSQVEELISRKLKEREERIMPSLRDRASRPFTLEIISIIVPRDATI